jgi:enoyl-CoA hydratase/carnithine racemase
MEAELYEALSRVENDERIRVVFLKGEGRVFSAGHDIDAFGGATGIKAKANGGWAELQLFPSQRLTAAGGFGIDKLTDDRRTLLPR